MQELVETREYIMYYRGPGFLAVVWFCSFPLPFPHLLSASCLSFSVFLCVSGKKIGQTDIFNVEQQEPWTEPQGKLSFAQLFLKTSRSAAGGWGSDGVWNGGPKAQNTFAVVLFRSAPPLPSAETANMTSPSLSLSLSTPCAPGIHACSTILAKRGAGRGHYMSVKKPGILPFYYSVWDLGPISLSYRGGGGGEGGKVPIAAANKLDTDR